MRSVWLLVVLLFVSGCAAKARIARPSTIQVRVRQQGTLGNPVQLNETQAKVLYQALAQGREEWAIFVPTYQVVLGYGSNEEYVLVGDQHFRIGNDTYRVNDNLDALITTMVH